MYKGASVRKSAVDSRICHGGERGSCVDAMALVLATAVSFRERGRGRSSSTERGIGGGDSTARASLYESMEVETVLQLASAKQFQCVFSRPMSDGIIQRGTQWLQFTDEASPRQLCADATTTFTAVQVAGKAGQSLSLGKDPCCPASPRGGCRGGSAGVHGCCRACSAGPKPIPTTPVFMSSPIHRVNRSYSHGGFLQQVGLTSCGF